MTAADAQQEFCGSELSMFQFRIVSRRMALYPQVQSQATLEYYEKP